MKNFERVNLRVRFTDFRNAYVVTVAFIAFENERVEKLSFSFSRRRVYVPRGGAKMWK